MLIIVGKLGNQTVYFGGKILSQKSMSRLKRGWNSRKSGF